MEIIKVQSSVISKIGFDGKNIFVKFVENGWYKYANLPKSVFEKFLVAPSKGTFLNKTLKHLRQGVPCSNPEL